MSDYCEVRQSVTNDGDEQVFSLDFETTNQDEFEMVKKAIDEALNWRLFKPSSVAMTDDGK